MQLLLILCLLLTGADALGQNDQFFLPLSRAGSCGDLKGPEARNAMAACIELRETMDRFQAALDREKVTLPPEYVNITKKEGKELDGILQNRNVTSEQIARIRAITMDLNLKLDAFSQFSSTRGPLFPKLDVAAHTKSNSSEKSGYEVWWAYFADRTDPASYTKFRKDSSPATDQLYPGVYMMYTQSGPRKGRQIRVNVDSAAFPFDFDLPTP